GWLTGPILWGARDRSWRTGAPPATRLPRRGDRFMESYAPRISPHRSRTVLLLDHGSTADTPQCVAGFSPRAGLHSLVSEPDHADPTRRARPQDRDTQLGAVLANRYRAAGAGLLPSELRRLVHRRCDQCRVRAPH